MKTQNIIIIILCCISIVGCNKDVKFEPRETQNQNIEPSGLYPMSTRVLIPTGFGPTIGYLTDGRIENIPNSLWYLNSPFLVKAVLNSSGNMYSVVTNPNNIGSLPTNMGGLFFKGLAVESVFSDKIWLCRSVGSNHYLYSAVRNITSGNYEIDNEILLSGSLLGSSWVLHDIEARDSQFYGVMYNSTTSTSVIISVDISTGLYTAIKTYNNIVITGMDFDNNKMYMTVNLTNVSNYGELFILDLNSISTISMPLNITSATNVITSNNHAGYFLNLNFYGGHLRIYNGAVNSLSQIFWYDLASSSFDYNKTVSNRAIYSTSSSSFNTPSPWGGLMTDAAN